MRMRNLLAVLVATGALAFTGSVYAQNLNRDQVRQVQEALNNAGQNIEVDGIWGPNTQQALRDFQQGHGLQPTGRPDRDTMAALNVDVPAPMSGSSGASGTQDPAATGGSSGVGHMGSEAKGSRTKTDTLSNPSTVTPAR
ncbi:MAG TPA: peptidoglycan-binding domain-containing protein [Azospirillum sp.]|nr:peptidoglycan-binding domain-containing protein [Azospirillum sp.]